MANTLDATYETRQPGLRGGYTAHQVEVPVLSREEFDRLLADNPVGPSYKYGTAAGSPQDGCWVETSNRHPGYVVAMRHIGHGCDEPVAYCRDGN